MSAADNDARAIEVLLLTGLVLGVLLSLAAWCGEASACGRQTCPPGQEPELVQTYTDVLLPRCACVLR